MSQKEHTIGAMAASSSSINNMIVVSTLSAFKISPRRHEIIEKSWRPLLCNYFESQQFFFQHLDLVHEDTLRAFNVRQLKTQEDLSNFLLSSYATLSDEEFVECDALKVNWEIEESIAARLSYIQEYRPHIIFPAGMHKSIGAFSSLLIKNISLRQIRNLDSEWKIAQVFAKHYSLLLLLSVEQKKLIESPQLFEELMLSDHLEEKKKYLPLHTPEFLTQRLRDSKYVSRIPHEIIPMLNLSVFSDAQVQQLMIYNLKHLDKPSIGTESLNAIFKRLLSMSITKDDVQIPVESESSEAILISRSVPHFHPQWWENIPDSAFIRIPFQELNQEELFCLFYPKSFKNDEKFGAIMSEKGGWVTEITCQPLLKNDSVPTVYSSSLYLYLREVKAKQKYNRRRLALLSLEQYQHILPLLDPEIAKIGNEIFASVN